MNQNFSISHLKYRFGRFKLLIALFVIMACCFGAGYWLGDQSQASDSKLIKEQQQRLDRLYAEHDQQLQQLNFLQVEIEIEKQAAAHVQTRLQQQHQHNFKLQKELSFYQKIMAPELEAGGVAVDQFHVAQIADSNVYQYKIVLVQTEKTKRYAKGYVDLDIQGISQSVSTKFNIKQLVKDFDRKSLKFSFKYFQILEGQIALPENFIAQHVDLVVTLPSGKWQKFERFDRQFRFNPEIKSVE